jgi:hypothetical protein
MFKKILFPLISIFLLHRTIELLKTLWIIDASEFAIALQVLFAVLLNLFITGIFAFLGFAYATNQILSDQYYQVKNPKFIRKLSKIIQIEYFKKMLLLAFWGKKKNKLKYFDGTKKGLDNFDYQTKQSEFGHLGAFIVIQIITFPLMYKRLYIIAIATTLINFIFNFYPIILQRSHRINIARVKALINNSSLNCTQK